MTLDNVWRYDGRQAVVTGCSSGIGAATVREVHALGGRVIGFDIKPPADTMEQFVSVDMSDRGSIEQAWSSVDGPVDALFNCAGLSGGAGTAIQVMRVNFIGLRHLTELGVGALPAGSAIVNVASFGGRDYLRNMDAVKAFLKVTDFDDAVAWCEEHPEQFTSGGYAFSKQSMIVYTMARSSELASRGIRINCVGPGMTRTPMLTDSAKALGQEYLDRFPRPLGRDAEPEEQARVLVFLNSNAASYVSGQHIWTDGGLFNSLAVGSLSPDVLAR